LLDPVIEGYPGRGGVVEYGDLMNRAPFALGVCPLFITSTGRRLVAHAHAASWRRLLERARAGRVAELTLMADIADPSGGADARSGCLEVMAVFRPDPEDDGATPMLAIRLPEPMLQLADGAGMLAAFHDLADRAVRQFDPVSGYVDLGEYGEYIEPWQAPDRIDDATWTLLLTNRHVNALGGLHALRAAYPFASVEPVSTPSGNLIRLLTTTDPRDFDTTSRTRLRAVLQPILAALP
jgi:hypothetical protein